MRRVFTLVVSCVLASSTAVASPSGKQAKAAFDAGVAAYTKGDFAAASAKLEESYELEYDVETLFAWAQSERKLERCDRAIDLYKKLLDTDLPAENKQAIAVQVGECQAILAAQAPVEAAPPPEPVAPPPVAPRPIEEPKPVTPERRAWWKDPVGGTLVGVGVVGIGLGAVFLVQASGADKDKLTAATYPEFEALEAKAESRGRLGVIGLAVGGGLVLGGVIRYAMTSGKRNEPALTGWLAPSGGGLALGGRF
jgi:tetratricopeptide (TPR) repeat protein